MTGVGVGCAYGEKQDGVSRWTSRREYNQRLGFTAPTITSVITETEKRLVKQAELAAQKLGTLERQRHNMNQILEELERDALQAQQEIDGIEDDLRVVETKNAVAESAQMKTRIGACLRRMSGGMTRLAFLTWFNASKTLGRGQLRAQAETDMKRSKWYAFLTTCSLAQSVQAGSVLSAISRSRIEAAKREQMELGALPAAPVPQPAALVGSVDAKALAHDSLCIYFGHVRLALRRSAGVAFGQLQLHGRG